MVFQFDKNGLSLVFELEQGKMPLLIHMGPGAASAGDELKSGKMPLIHQDFGSVSANNDAKLTGARADVTDARTDVTDARTDVACVRTDAAGVRADVTDARTEVACARAGDCENGISGRACRQYIVPDEEKKRYYGIQEVQAAGESRLEHFGVGLSGTMPAARMAYIGYTETENERGTLLCIESQDPLTGLHSCMRYQFFTGLAVVRCSNILTNRGDKAITIEGVSTFVYTGLARDATDKASLLIPHNDWQEELQWRELSLYDLGYRNFSEPGASGKRIQIRSLGSWSSGEYLPMGCLRDPVRDTMEFWQIEHNGSWNWELQERDHQCALLISGPDEMDHGWWKKLEPGECFETVPACVGCVRGGVDEAMAELTRYRRTIRRKHPDHTRLPIIFNDYMNCLFGDPTTQKELPIIEAAADMGCEYYVIDAGWYTDENWWYKVGEWKPSETRFPNGLAEVTGFIRSKGMVPGLWLEIETMGTQCPLADQVPREWYFQRHGEVSLDRDRYHLDFRNPEVRAYTRGVIDRLIRDYGIGYFKIDYNINAFSGTDYAEDSAAEGLLEHNRAYLSWLDGIMDDYPDLLIENCSSGGMRMDYAMLSRYCLQSTSDQTDYQKYASIAANAPSAVTPEQAAVWSYPMAESSAEQVIFNCVNASLLRIHQSGHFALLSEETRNIVREFYAFYREIRADIPDATPFWPLGFAKEGDGQMALGLRWEDRAYLAVWRLNGDPVVSLPISGLMSQLVSRSMSQMMSLPKSQLMSCPMSRLMSLPKSQLEGALVDVRTAFPKEDTKCTAVWDAEKEVLRVSLPEEYMARVIEVKVRSVSRPEE